MPAKRIGAQEMATTPDALISQLPPFAQLLIYALIGLGTAALAWKAYFDGKKAPPIPSKDVVLTGGTIADMEPVRKLVDAVEGMGAEIRSGRGKAVDALETLTAEAARVGNCVERLVELAEQEAKERAIERELDREREIDRRLRDDTPPRRRR